MLHRDNIYDISVFHHKNEISTHGISVLDTTLGYESCQWLPAGQVIFAVYTGSIHH
jgi:hypothetical protein